MTEKQLEWETSMIAIFTEQRYASVTNSIEPHGGEDIGRMDIVIWHDVNVKTMSKAAVSGIVLFVLVTNLITA